MSSLVPRHVFGLYGAASHTLYHIDDQNIIYPAGSSLIVYNVEQRTQRIVPLNEGGIVTALAVSSRLIAVAEKTEKRGTVTLLDTHTLKRKKYLREEDSHLTKSTISISLTSNSKYLSTVSGEPEWHLQLWNWENGKVIASVKLNYAPNVKVIQQSFNPFEKTIPTICVVGTNLFRIYRFIEGSLKPLTLQKADHRNNVSHTWLSSERIAVTTDDGKVVIHETGGSELHSELPGNLSPNDPNRPVHYLTSIRAGLNGFITGSNYGMIQIWEKGETLYRCMKQVKVDNSAIQGVDVSHNEDTIICATNSNQLISINSMHSSSSDDLKIENVSHAHHDSITGLDSCIRKPIVVTCGNDMSIRVWNYMDNSMDTAIFFVTEPTSVALHPSGLFVLAGFSDGLKLLKILLDDIQPYWELPVRHCRECRFSNGGQFFALAHGAVVTVRSTWSYDLISTYKGHSGKVRSISWSPDDSRLLTVCSDGICVEWDTCTQKRIAEYTHPSLFSAATFSFKVGSILLGTGDGRIVEYQESQCTREFHVHSPIVNIKICHTSRSVLACTTSGELKSIRYPFGTLEEVSQVHMHQSPITRLSLSHDERYVFSASSDGCLCITQVHEKAQIMSSFASSSSVSTTVIRESRAEGVYSDEVLALRPDIHSQMKIMAELKKQIDHICGHNELLLKERDDTYQRKLDDLVHQFEADRQVIVRDNEQLGYYLDTLVASNRQQLTELKDKHAEERLKIESSMSVKMNAELERARLLNKSMEYKQQNGIQQTQSIKGAAESETNLMRQLYDKQIHDKDSEKQAIEKEIHKRQAEHELRQTELEASTDQEVLQVQYYYEQLLKEERLHLGSIQDENNQLRETFDALMHKIDQNKFEIAKMSAEEKKLIGVIKTTEKEMAGAKRELEERNDTIDDKEKRISDLKKKNKELEKFKFVLDYKIVELHKQISPREQQIQHLQMQQDHMNDEISGYRDTKNQLVLTRKDLLQKLGGCQGELGCVKDQRIMLERQVDCIQKDVHGLMASHHLVKQVLRSLYNQYCLLNTVPTEFGDGFDLELRQREIHERTCLMYHRKLNKQIASRTLQTTKLVNENVMLTQELNRIRKQWMQPDVVSGPGHSN